MSSAGLGGTTTLLGGSPSGQAASHVNNQTQFTLVLGGGGMKGVAHVGVLQALTERGFVPAQVVGSSVGALVGAAWSAGKSIPELRNPLIVNTVDLNSGMQVFWGLEGLDEIPVRDAVFASCALPGYLPPRE